MKVRPRLTIEARQLTFETFEDVKAWCHGETWSRPPMRAVTGIQFNDVDGRDQQVPFGDWVLRGSHGFFPCPADAFAERYEEVVEEES